MNEGWASYWHIRILRELELSEEETLEFAKLNASVIQPSKTSINPYYLGLKLFEDIERRWDQPTVEQQHRGQTPGEGREKIFEVRELEMDTSFIRNYLTKQLVRGSGSVCLSTNRKRMDRDGKGLESGAGSADRHPGQWRASLYCGGKRRLYE